mmetsp:Transcript_47248/g.134792  ORF Transcript_47248/g.134792 Transcript_47248/m.134792 type:complete len:260 (+) Transcript_47248:1524-2303(+)
MWRFGVALMLNRAITHFATPPKPAQASMWPKLVFELVTIAGTSRSHITDLRAPTSIGSPRVVPVPWHSAIVIMLAVRPASCIEARMQAACEGPLGAVRLALRPSWFVAQATEQASICWASSSLSPEDMKAAQQPSPRRKPLAPSSNVKERPLLESIMAAQYAKKVSGPSSMQTPMTRVWFRRALAVGARWSFSFWPNVRCAWLKATRLEEQAVSTVTHGPRMPSVWESLPELTPLLQPAWSLGHMSHCAACWHCIANAW